MPKGYIDKLLGGRLRDAGPGSATSADLGSAITDENYTEFVNLVENILTLIDSLNYNEGDTITAEMIANYTAIFEQLSNFNDEINNLENVSQEFKDFVSNLLTSYNTAINTLVEGEQITTEQITSITDALTVFQELLNQFVTNPITSNLQQFIEDVTQNYLDNSIATILNNLAELIYNEGDAITAVMIQRYENLYAQLSDFYTEISEMDSVSQDYKDYILSLLQAYESAINNLTEGENLTAQQLTDITTALTDLQTALQQVLDATSPASLTQLIQDIFNDFYGTPGNAETVLLSGSITWKEGLTYVATRLRYKILGVPYTAEGREITLTAADATYARKDIFVADRTGNVYAIAGDPLAAPIKPVAAYDQLEITTADIPANATEPAGVTIETVYNELDPAEWTPTTQTDTGVTIDTADTDPADGTKNISVAVAIPDTELAAKAHYLGEYYQGGIIVWIDRSSNGKKGMIAAIQDVHDGIFYESLSGAEVYTTGATGTAIEDSAANTALLAAHDRAKDYAVKYCIDYVHDGFSDWVFPSLNALLAIYNNRHFLNGLASASYWSSTEVSFKKASRVDFTTGDVASRDKNNRYHVRPVRFFDDTTIETGVPVDTFTPETTQLKLTAPAQKSIVNAILTAQLKSSKLWLKDSALLIEAWNNGSRTGRVLLQKINTFGYDPNNLDYQFIAIPLYTLAATVTEITDLTIRLINTWPNNITLKLDNIRLQYDESLVRPATLGTLAYVNHLVLTQAEYDAIPTKDSNTIYFIPEV